MRTRKRKRGQGGRTRKASGGGGGGVRGVKVTKGGYRFRHFTRFFPNLPMKMK